MKCRTCREPFPAYYVTASGHCADCAIARAHGIAPRRREIPRLPRVADEKLEALTSRQRDVYRRLAAGLSVASIARTDGRDERAMRKLVARIRAKLAA